MEVIELLRRQLSLSDEVILEVKEEILQVERFVGERQIIFGSDYAIGFYSHMYSLISRLKKKEHLELDDLSIKDGLDETAFSIADELVGTLSKRYGLSTNVSEVCLVAIHVQTAMEMAKEAL